MPNTDIDNTAYYAVLNVSRDATLPEIRDAYRKAAAIFHPDKQPTDELRATATETFHLIQEAYEALSDPQRRRIYDVYGKAGLQTGLELGPNHTTWADIQAAMDARQAREAQGRLLAHTNQRGVFVCRIDATSLCEPYHRRSPQSKHFVQSIFAQNSADIPITDMNFTGTIGCQALMKKNKDGNFVGGSSLLLSGRSLLTREMTLDTQLMVGLRKALTMTTTHSIGEFGTATCSGSWDGQNIALQLGHQQQLSDKTSGMFTWVVGPEAATGVALQLTHRREFITLIARLDLGALIALSARLIYQCSETMTLRAVLRLGGPTVADIELAVTERIGEYSQAAVSVTWGLPGTAVKLELRRGGQAFVLPVVLSNHWDSWHIAVAAYVAPPLVYFATRRFVVKPLIAWYSSRQGATSREIDTARREVEKALEQVRLIARPADRATRDEIARNGLVIVEAVYGSIGSYLDSLWTANGDVSVLSSDESLDGERASTATGADDVDTIVRRGCMDVTAAVRYLVRDSRVVFNAGFNKSALMGFADVAPGRSKKLFVLYFFHGLPFSATVEDVQGCELPQAGEAITDARKKQVLYAKLARNGSRTAAMSADLANGGVANGSESSTPA